MQRKLTPDELNQLEGMGYNTSKYKGELVEFPDPETSSVTGVVGRSALANALPATAGAASFAAGMSPALPWNAAAIAAAPETMGISLAVPIISGIGTSMLGAGLTRKVQDVVTPQTVLDRLSQDVVEHPIAARVGDIGASLLTMRPSLSVTKNAIKGAAQLPAASIAGSKALETLNPVYRAALGNVALGAGISGAIEAGQELANEGTLHPGRILAETGIGALLNKPTRLGSFVMRQPVHSDASRPIDSEVGLRQAQGTVQPVDIGNQHVKAFRDSLIGQKQFNESAIELAQETLRKQEELKVEQERIKQTQAELADATAKALEEAKYSREAFVKTPTEQEVQTDLANQKIPTAPTKQFNKSVDDLLLRKNIGVQEVPTLDTKGMMRPNGTERKIFINPAKETIDTRAHEGQHYEISEIEAAAQNGDARAKKFMEDLYGKQKESLDAYNKQLAEKGQAPVDAHEFATTEQGAEFVKQQLNLKKEGEWKKWWNDTKSLWSQRFGVNPSVSDLQRALNYRFVNREGMGTLGQKGPLGEVKNPVAPVSSVTRENKEQTPTTETPAIRYGDKVYTGSWHGKAAMDLSEDLYKRGIPLEQAKAERGIVNKDGVFTQRNAEENRGIHRDEGFNTKEGDDVLSNPQEDIIVNDKLPKGIKDVAGGIKAFDYSPEDLAKYKTLKADQVKMQDEKRIIGANGEFHPDWLKNWKEFEELRNKYNGMPPKQLVEGSKILKDEKVKPEDLNRNSEAGRGIERTEKDERPFMTSSERILNTIKGAQNGKQILNTLKNKIPPAEYEILKQAGLEKEFSDIIAKPENVKKWIQENGPHAEVHSYGMEGKVSEAKKEYDRMTHELETQQSTPGLKEWVQAVNMASTQDDITSIETQIKNERFSNYTPKERNQLANYIGRKREILKEPRDTSPRATDYYNTVSALPTDEPMPEWTTTKSGKNVQRVDVVIPHKDEIDPASIASGYHAGKKRPLWQPDNLHENLPNTLGWAMIQYKTGLKGEKIAVIAEAQSRWGQERRAKESNIEVKQDMHGRWILWDKRDNNYENAAEGDPSRYTNTTKEDALIRKEKIISNRIGVQDHPLLRDYNRLILKAAIEQARKEGATHIMVSDAETAMMTEGHDANAYSHIEGEYDNAQQAQAKALELNENSYETLPEQVDARRYRIGTRNGKWTVEDSQVQDTISQEPGMRLNYDTILPKIAEELTGSKGEKVSLGEHKNAFKDTRIPADLRDKGQHKFQRDNLIFRNADGTPKTDISGMMYELPKARTEPYSYFERRNAEEGRGLERTDSTPIEPDNSRKGFLPGLEATFDKVERVSPIHAQAARDYENRKDQYQGQANVAMSDLSKFKPEDVDRVMAERRKAYREGGEPTLTGEKDAEISNILKNYYGKIADTRRALGIRIDGREAGKNEYYVPDMMNAHTLDLFINKPLSTEAQFAKNAWAEHAFNEAEGKIPIEKIRSDIRDYIEALNGKDSNYKSLEFGAIRRAAGFGLPEELRDKSALNTLARYSRRASADLAFFQEIQNKPEIAGPLKIKDQNGELHPGYNESELSQSPLIQNMMQWITGNVSGRIQNQPKVSALIRLVHNSLLGPATGIRDLVSVPMNALPYINKFSDLGAAWQGLMDTRKNSRMALETAARQPSIDRVQFNEVLNSPDRFSAVVGKVADAMRKAQGREFIENLSRDITFSMGKELGRNNVLGAKAGDAQSKNWLKKFGDLIEGDVTKMKGPELEAALNQIGKNFTDRNQGTYGGRGLPLGAVDSQFAPFFSLQKWALEKSNVIYKDVYKPFITGENRLPMLTYTLGSFMTGAAIQQLNKLMSGRKSQDPELNEALAKATPANVATELTTIMQLGNYAGIVSDSLKFLADTTLKGKIPRNIVSFPTASAAVKTEENVSHMLEAIRQGENPWDVLKMFSLDMAVNNVQALRLLANRTWKDEQIERSDKFRDVRVFNELEGKPASATPSVNPYLNLEQKEFKRTSDLGEAAKLAPNIVKSAVRKAEGNPLEAKRNLESLKGNSYQTVPSPTTSPDEFTKFYNFLVQTQGKKVADERVKDFMRQNAVNKIKSRMIP